MTGDFRFVKVNCHTSDDFWAMWRKVFRELEGGEPEHVPATPDDVRYTLQQLEGGMVIILDELDRIEDDEALSLLADTIKSLSDGSVRTTLILVGVADSIDALVGDHASIERALVQVQLPRMSENELAEIVDRGCNTLGMTIETPARLRIARLSEGLPHYTHLLALNAAQEALQNGRLGIMWADVNVATELAVQKAQHSIRQSYLTATRSPQPETLFPQVLLACALAPKDELGYFRAADVRGPMSAIMKKPYDIPAFARHLTGFTDESRGEVLQRTGAKKRYSYRFTNPLLQPYVVMKGLADHLISDDMLRDVQKGRRDYGIEDEAGEPDEVSDGPSAPEPLF